MDRQGEETGLDAEPSPAPEAASGSATDPGGTSPDAGMPAAFGSHPVAPASSAGDAPGSPGEAVATATAAAALAGGAVAGVVTPGTSGWRPPTAESGVPPVWRPAAPGPGAPWVPPASPPPPGASAPAAGSPWVGPPAPARRRPPQWAVVAVVAALVGGAVGAGIAEAVGTGSSGSTGSATVKVGQVAPGPALAGGAQIPTIVKSVLPEVVSIDAKGPATGSNPLFGGSGTNEDQGTGMIVSTNGEIITNNHVIAGATAITVTLYGKTTALPATLVGADPSNDVALLRISSPPANLEAVTFGDSTKLEVGDALIAVGNALGLSAGTPTVTSGIVSALGRTVQASDESGNGTGETLNNMIQTDAAINSGNSGGPLVDSAGQVVGMNTAVASSSTGNAPAQNIGFAITSSTIQGLLGTLRSGGSTGVAKPYLGVEVTDETPSEQQAYGLTPASGALVVSVVSGSPAQAAGIETGDVIVSFDGKAVTSAQGLTNLVQASSTGHAAQVTLYRGPQKLTVTATLALAPAS